MFLMADGTAVLHGISFVKSVGAAAEFGVTGFAPFIDFLNPAGGSAPAKTIAYHLRKLSRSQLPARDERFVMTSVAIAGGTAPIQFF